MARNKGSKNKKTLLKEAAMKQALYFKKSLKYRADKEKQLRENVLGVAKDYYTDTTTVRVVESYPRTVTEVDALILKNEVQHLKSTIQNLNLKISLLENRT